jgi:hypothetical protein
MLGGVPQVTPDEWRHFIHSAVNQVVVPTTDDDQLGRREKLGESLPDWNRADRVGVAPDQADGRREPVELRGVVDAQVREESTKGEALVRRCDHLENSWMEILHREQPVPLFLYCGHPRSG